LAPLWDLRTVEFHALFDVLTHGVPLVDGELFAVIWIVCGDMEFLSNELRMLTNSNDPFGFPDAIAQPRMYGM
jgi:hypothetical protein